MRFALRIIFISCVYSTFFSCKKEKKADPAPTPAVNQTPCNATNLAVSSITETNGQSKVYKLSITNYTSTSSTTYSALAATYQVTMTVEGDTTVLGNLPGKRYNIKGTNGWNFKAYSYYKAADSLWYLISLESSEQQFFDMAFKLPIVANITYSANLHAVPYNFTTGSSSCIMVNNQNYPVFTIANSYYNSFPELDTREFYVNQSGLISWAYNANTINTQNQNSFITIWTFDFIN